MFVQSFGIVRNICETPFLFLQCVDVICTEITFEIADEYVIYSYKSNCNHVIRIL